MITEGEQLIIDELKKIKKILKYAHQTDNTTNKIVAEEID